MVLRPVFVAALTALGVAAAGAQEDGGFAAPSGNIACDYFEGFLRCDLMEISNRVPPRPDDCDLDWGKAFGMAADDRSAYRLCHGDTVFGSSTPVLDYGSSWSRGGFTCISTERGLTCRNAHGAGWDLSRGNQVLY